MIKGFEVADFLAELIIDAFFRDSLSLRMKDVSHSLLGFPSLNIGASMSFASRYVATMSKISIVFWLNPILRIVTMLAFFYLSIKMGLKP